MAKRTICVMGRVLDQEDGLHIYANNLLKHMMVADPDTRYVILLRTPKHFSMFDDFSNAEVHVIPAMTKLLWDQIFVPYAAWRMEADIIFNPKFSIPLLSRRPSVMVLHGSDWYVNPKNYEWWDNFYIRTMIPIYSKKAKQLLSISQCVLDDLVKFAGIERNKVTVTYAAPSPHFQPINSESLLRQYSRRYNLPDRFIFCVARTLHTGHGSLPEYPGGNLEGLLKGYRHYRSNGGSLPLVIAGKEIDSYLNNRGLLKDGSESILFLGFVPHEEMVYLYNLAELFVLTTLYESFGLPIIEAMASGCPAIVPSTGACPEVAGGAAMLIDPLHPEQIGNAMYQVENSPELRREMHVKGLERASHFTWRRTAELSLKAFDNITRSKIENSKH